MKFFENNCENANTQAHSVVGTFAKKKMLELMLINLGKQERFFWCSSKTRLALGVEYCFDPLCFGSNIQLGCVVL